MSGAAVSVANPLLVKWIASAPVKTDAHDTVKLARLLAAGLLPTVWVPPEPVRTLRTLVAQHRRLIKQRTRLRNRLQGLLQRHQILPPEGGNLFSPAQRSWWLNLQLPPVQQLLVRQDLEALDQLEAPSRELREALYLQSTSQPWINEIPFLIQQTGIGILTAMTLIAAIGDIRRFEHASQLVGYAGLGARVHDSGQTHKRGRITKQGRPDLRAAMVEAAWVAVSHNAHWKAKFAAYSRRMSSNQAIVAIARQMLVCVWHLWHDRTIDRHTDAATIARKLCLWAEQGRKTMRRNLTCAQFVRLQLDQLGIGQNLNEFYHGGRVHRLPPPGTVPNVFVDR
jgi:transposase